MKTPLQTLILIVLIIVSVNLTKFETEKKKVKTSPPAVASISGATRSESFNFESIVSTVASPMPQGPVRKWDVLDPKISAEAAAIYSLEGGNLLFSFNIEKKWPSASLAKLLTALVVAEEIGLNKKIPISSSAVAIEGEAGNLSPGDIYTARDLLKIMLLTSSNDAAVSFEEYVGGKNFFARMMNNKAEAIGMKKSIFYDAAGLADLNKTTASDMLTLVKYIINYEPDILAWTRMQNFIAQPINNTNHYKFFNINSLASNSNFLGGKTGTLPEARQNLAAVFSLPKARVIFILLGSTDRLKEAEYLLQWVEKAYEF